MTAASFWTPWAQRVCLPMFILHFSAWCFEFKGCLVYVFLTYFNTHKYDSCFRQAGKVYQSNARGSLRVETSLIPHPKFKLGEKELVQTIEEKIFTFTWNSLYIWNLNILSWLQVKLESQKGRNTVHRRESTKRQQENFM